jgi:hypothetical protein
VFDDNLIKGVANQGGSGGFYLIPISVADQFTVTVGGGGDASGIPTQADWILQVPFLTSRSTSWQYADYQVVPLPAALPLLATGILGLLGLQRARSRRSSVGSLGRLEA